MKKLRAIYHFGESLNLKTKVMNGWVSVDSSNLYIFGDKSLEIPLQNITKVELTRLHGSGRVIRVETHSHGIFFISVVRFCLFGQFAIVNFFGTGNLFDLLSKKEL